MSGVRVSHLGPAKAGCFIKNNLLLKLFTIFSPSLPPQRINSKQESPRPSQAGKSFFNAERTALKNRSHYSSKADAHHPYYDKHILNPQSLFSRAIEFISAVRIDKKLYRFSYHSLRLCCSDKRFHPLLDTFNRIFVNWKPRFQPHFSAGRRISNPNTFSLHINHSCSYQLGAGTSFLPPSYAQSNPNAKKCNADYAQYQHEQYYQCSFFHFFFSPC